MNNPRIPTCELKDWGWPQNNRTPGSRVPARKIFQYFSSNISQDVIESSVAQDCNMEYFLVFVTDLKIFFGKVQK